MFVLILYESSSNLFGITVPLVIAHYFKWGFKSLRKFVG